MHAFIALILHSFHYFDFISIFILSVFDWTKRKSTSNCYNSTHNTLWRNRHILLTDWLIPHYCIMGRYPNVLILLQQYTNNTRWRNRHILPTVWLIPHCCIMWMYQTVCKVFPTMCFEETPPAQSFCKHFSICICHHLCDY